MVVRSFALLAALALSACTVAVGGADGADGRSPAQDRRDATAGPWTDLFDGQSLDGWRGYASDAVSPKWSVADGVMTLTPDGGAWDADLVADGTWDDFELEVEWQIAECGNSGLFYRGEEDPDRAIWATALEAQILDDTCHPDGKYPSHRAGGLYDLYVPETDAPAEGGVWHTTRIVADGDVILHYLNGDRVVDARQGSADWTARVAVSKFRDGDTFPAYGTRRSGLIGIQDHGDTLRVRAVRIRTL